MRYELSATGETSSSIIWLTAWNPSSDGVPTPVGSATSKTENARLPSVAAKQPMIPYLFFFGIAGGFTKLKWWTVAPAAALWGGILVYGGEPEINPVVLFGVGLLAGGLNAAVGVAITLGIRWVARKLWEALQPLVANRRRPGDHRT